MDILGLKQALNLSLSSDKDLRKSNADMILKVIKFVIIFIFTINAV